MVTNRRTVQAEDEEDFYPTEPWPTWSLFGHEVFEGSILEPACGDGAMAKIISAAGHNVIAKDLNNQGYGKTGCDFLRPSPLRYDNVITNPPYNEAEAFVHQALKTARKKVAMLLRLAFLEGGDRGDGLYVTNPPSHIWIFSRRLTFYPKRDPGEGKGTTAYAWFIWDKARATQGNPTFGWIRDRADTPEHELRAAAAIKQRLV